MGDYFKGWKRKVGVLTLFVACAAMGGWVTSSVFEDHISSPFSQGDNAYLLEILSMNQQTGIDLEKVDHSFGDFQIQQNFVEFIHAIDGNDCPVEIERRHVLELADILQSSICNCGTPEVELRKTCEFADMFHALVRHFSLREIEGRQVFEFADVFQPNIGDLSFNEVECRQVFESTDCFQAVICNIGVAEN
jgi:hypothetical protein